MLRRPELFGSYDNLNNLKKSFSNQNKGHQ